MKRFSDSHSSKSGLCFVTVQNSLYRAVRQMDRDLLALEDIDMTLEELTNILKRVEQFNKEAANWQAHTQEANAPFAGKQENNPQYLIAVGCRLASDLSEKALMRSMELLSEQEEKTQALCKQVRHVLRKRHNAQSLVYKAQSVRQEINVAAERSGLGIVL